MYFFMLYFVCSPTVAQHPGQEFWPPARIQGQKLSWPGNKRNKDSVAPLPQLAINGPKWPSFVHILAIIGLFVIIFCFCVL